MEFIKQFLKKLLKNKGGREINYEKQKQLKDEVLLKYYHLYQLGLY